MRIRNFTRIAALTAVLSIALAMPALAQEVGEDPYQGPAAQQQQAVLGGSESAPEGTQPAAEATQPAAEATQPATVEASSSGGALPFTGFEIGLAAGLGIALLGIGFVLRRAGRADASS